MPPQEAMHDARTNFWLKKIAMHNTQSTCFQLLNTVKLTELKLRKGKERAPAPGTVFRVFAEPPGRTETCNLSVQQDAQQSWTRGRIQPRLERARSPEQTCSGSGEEPEENSRACRARWLVANFAPCQTTPGLSLSKRS
jgi:hypothetical protein